MTFSSGDFVDIPSMDAGPVLVFHCYLSVPLMPSSFGMLYSWVSARLSKPVTHWTILVDQWCDNYNIYCHKNLIPNSNIAFLQMDNYEGCISDIIRYYTGQYTDCPGTIVLITAKDNFPHIEELKSLGWKVIVVHPPVADVGLVDLGHVTHELPMHQPADFRNLYLTSWFCGRVTQRVTLPKLSNPEPMVPLDSDALGQFLRNFSSTTMGPNWRASYPMDIVFKQSFEEFISETLACTAVRTVSGIIRNMIINADSDERMTVELNTTMAPIGTKRKKRDEPDEVKSDEMKTDEKKTDDTKTDDMKADDIKTDELKMDELKTDKVTLELKPKTQEEEKPIVVQPKVDVAKSTPKLQCPKFHRTHHQREKCPNRHPRRNCEYYPRCRTTAAHCGYAHPFCNKTKGPCKCPPTARNPQLNHNLG